MRSFKFALFIVLLVSCHGSAQAPQLLTNFKGKVIGIKDGDTIEVLYQNKTIVIRLAHIDCPEIKGKQPFGKEAKKFTSDICFGQTVIVENDGKYDVYKRLIAVIINSKGQNVNKELVKSGFAWHFLKYSSDTSYDRLQALARQNKIGLWADENPTPPWQWRKPQK